MAFPYFQLSKRVSFSYFANL